MGIFHLVIKHEYGVGDLGNRLGENVKQRLRLGQLRRIVTGDRPDCHNLVIAAYLSAYFMFEFFLGNYLSVFVRRDNQRGSVFIVNCGENAVVYRKSLLYP